MIVTDVVLCRWKLQRRFIVLAWVRADAVPRILMRKMALKSASEVLVSSVHGDFGIV